MSQGQGSFSAASSRHRGPWQVFARGAVGELADLLGRGSRRPGTTALLPVELGAGTGLLTGQLQRAGVQVVAVEPDATRRAHLRRALPDATLLDTAGDALPLRSAAVPAVLTADPAGLHPSVAAEVARVLAPDAPLVVVTDAADGTPGVSDEVWGVLADAGFTTSASEHRHQGPDGVVRTTTVVTARRRS